MTRIAVTSLLVAVGLGAFLAARTQDPAKAEPKRQIAVTVDDLPLAGGPNDLETARSVTRRILAALRAHRVPAIGFVNEDKLQVTGEIAERTALLEAWLDSEMALGNHTYSHADVDRMPLAQYQEDILRGEVVTRRLLESRGKKLEYFRHPFTHTGAIVETKAGLEAFLREKRYKIAPFTIENADYLFNTVYVRAARAGDEALRDRVRTAYLDHTEAVTAFIEKLSVDTFGREIGQILLIHTNALNADALDALLSRLEGRGYAFVSLDDALADEAYRTPDLFVGRFGPSWLHRWSVSKAFPSESAKSPTRRTSS